MSCAAADVAGGARPSALGTGLGCGPEGPVPAAPDCEASPGIETGNGRPLIQVSASTCEARLESTTARPTPSELAMPSAFALFGSTSASRNAWVSAPPVVPSDRCADGA